jgi:hypothetical protein
MDESKTPLMLDSEDNLHIDELLSVKQGHLQQKVPRVKCFTVLLYTWTVLSILIIGFLAASRTMSTIPIALEITPDVYRPASLPPNLNLCNCGSSIAEALRLGCEFDSMAAAWLPAYCRDPELTAEFEHSGPGPNGSWPYFADEVGTQPLDLRGLALLGDGEGPMWATREWHIAHCMFYWRKYSRMRDTGAVMEERFDHVEHVKHCTRLIRHKMTGEEPVLIKVNVRMNARIVLSGEQ